MNFDTCIEALGGLAQKSSKDAATLLALAVRGHDLGSFASKYREYRAEDAVRALARTEKYGGTFVDAALKLLQGSVAPDAAPEEELVAMASMIELTQVPAWLHSDHHRALEQWMHRVEHAHASTILERAHLRGRDAETTRAALLRTLQAIGQAMSRRGYSEQSIARAQSAPGDPNDHLRHVRRSFVYEAGK